VRDEGIRNLGWGNLLDIGRQTYTCSYCSSITAPSNGYCTTRDGGQRQGFIFICPNCNRPTYIYTESNDHLFISPQAMMGATIEGLPDDIDQLYNEARQSTGVGAYTSAVLTCRKILMHVAVSRDADENLTFLNYVDYLDENNYIPAEARGWVDHIRERSNDANHEIEIMSNQDAEDLITFTEMLLRIIYEFQNRLQRREDQLGERPNQ